MDTVFKKLNFKGQSLVVIINHPDSFAPNLNSIREDAKIVTNLKDTFKIPFITQKEQIDYIVPQFMGRLAEDAIVWMCYPKDSSKKYKCDFNRDTGWSILGQHNMEGVRMVAIDQDWSALRFRQIDHIKTMKRSFAMSEKGKKKVQQNK